MTSVFDAEFDVLQSLIKSILVSFVHVERI